MEEKKKITELRPHDQFFFGFYGECTVVWAHKLPTGDYEMLWKRNKDNSYNLATFSDGVTFPVVLTHE